MGVLPHHFPENAGRTGAQLGGNLPAPHSSAYARRGDFAPSSAGVAARSRPPDQRVCDGGNGTSQRLPSRALRAENAQRAGCDDLLRNFRRLRFSAAGAFAGHADLSRLHPPRAD